MANKLYNGVGGEFIYKGRKVGKVRQWRLDINRDAVDVSSIGEPDGDYILTARKAQGSATVWYDSLDSPTVELFNSLLSNDTNKVKLRLVIDATDAKFFEFEAVVPSLSTGAGVNEVTSAEIQFQVCGAITGSL